MKRGAGEADESGRFLAADAFNSVTTHTLRRKLLIYIVLVPRQMDDTRVRMGLHCEVEIYVEFCGREINPTRVTVSVKPLASHA
jgi:hypothetical protein